MKKLLMILVVLLFEVYSTKIGAEERKMKNSKYNKTVYLIGESLSNHNDDKGQVTVIILSLEDAKKMVQLSQEIRKLVTEDQKQNRSEVKENQKITNLHNQEQRIIAPTRTKGNIRTYSTEHVSNYNSFEQRDKIHDNLPDDFKLVSIQSAIHNNY